MTANCRSRNIARKIGCIWCVGSIWCIASIWCAVPAFGQAPKPAPPPVAAQASSVPATAAGPSVDLPPDYVIGPDDVLGIIYWKDKDMTTDAHVRPDGRIALPLLNDVQAAGLTPEQLRKRLIEESQKYMEDPNITVVVRMINSRRTFITGEVNKPGAYPLAGPTSVMQLIAMAGGLRDYANSKKIVIMRTESGRQISLQFNYKDVIAGKNLKQNIELKPGDTVVVP